MRSARLRWVVGLATLLVVLVHARMASPQILSPGPLSKAHASVEGDQHCNECHSSGKRVSVDGCLRCHNDLGARISAGKGLHGLQYKGKPCESCHVEHLGAAALMRWPGGDPSKLDHTQTGWVLNGAHKTTPCAKCHNKVNQRGNPTYLGLSSSACVPCHKDQHEGRFGQACLSCHNESVWKDVNLKTFNHDLARFALRGAHQTVPCAKCHFEPPKWVGLKFAQCQDCHHDPHDGRLGPNCTDCHEDTRWKPVLFTHKGAKHPGTSLANGHAAVPCRTCHDRGNLVSPSKGRECVSCHTPVHKAPFGRACGTCHGAIQWVGLPPSVGFNAHSITAYPLAGKHVSVKCAGCHKPEWPREARFKGLAFARCDDCHEDQHRGEFAKNDRGECKPCHSLNGFYPTLFGTVAHASTRFPLEGQHTASPCLSCHKLARPRLDLRVAQKACADCHANPHGNQFAKEMADGGCAHCHAETGWSLPKIDHSIWPLIGAHATAQCDSCHHPTPEDRKAGKGASYLGIARNCGGCHDDVHLGQFRLSSPVFECDKCHTPKSFKIPDFDHQAITGWALTGAHAPLECIKCHPAANLIAGQRNDKRWRLPSHECKFCHANPHEPRGAT
jgi:hypothetical protein